MLAVSLLATLGGSACSRQALVVVESCPEGGGGFMSCARDGASPDAVSTLRNGLVGLWHLDEAPGSPMALDSSGLASPNNGVLKDLDQATAWVSGPLGGALETKGVGYVLVPRSPSIDSIKSEVTVAAWVYLQGTIMEYGTALSRQRAATIDQYYHLSLAAGAEPAAWLGRALPSPFNRLVGGPGIKPVQPMTWTHLALVYDGANGHLYVDGTEVDVKPITGTFGDDTTPLILGANQNEDQISERFPGRLDEIVLYNRALSDNEVRALASGNVF
jgi:hypothetical protein